MKFHKNFNNLELARTFRAIAAAYKIQKENLFRIRAYENAAESVEHASREVRDLWEEGKLQDLPGIGANSVSYTHLTLPTILLV